MMQPQQHKTITTSPQCINLTMPKAHIPQQEP